MKILDKIIAPSTQALIKASRRAEKYSLFDFLHGYIYGRWPYLYIGVGTGEHPLSKRLKPVFNWISTRLFKPSASDLQQAADQQADPNGLAFANTYHGKVVPLELARQLVTIKEEIHLPDLEQVIPYSQARALILQNPDHIIALDCPCRSARLHPCLPLDVCLIVGEPFASFVLEHHPTRARRISQDEAVEILKAEDQRGHVHHAFFKDAMLGRFYAICNCCSCCCGAMQAHSNGVPMLASSGFLAQVDPDDCIQCEICISYCQFGALSASAAIDVATGREYIHVDAEKCMGCGVCVSKCPPKAISLRLEPMKGIPLDIRSLTG